MLTAQVPIGPGAESAGYGYGWFTGTRSGEPWFHHDGDNPGFRAFAACLPESERRIVLLSNSEATGAAEMSAVLDRALG
jgi:hypothetical protein